MKNLVFVFALLLSACASSPFSGPNPFEHTELLLEAEQAIEGLINVSGEGFRRNFWATPRPLWCFPIW